MTADEMKEYLSLYGTDLEKWPEELMHEAFAACLASAELREMVVAAREAAAVSAAAMPPEGLALHLIEEAQARERSRGGEKPRKKIWWFLLLLLVGMIIWLLIPSG